MGIKLQIHASSNLSLYLFLKKTFSLIPIQRRRKRSLNLIQEELNNVSEDQINNWEIGAVERKREILIAAIVRKF